LLLIYDFGVIQIAAGKNAGYGTIDGWKLAKLPDGREPIFKIEGYGAFLKQVDQVQDGNTGVTYVKESQLFTIKPVATEHPYIKELHQLMPVTKDGEPMVKDGEPTERSFFLVRMMAKEKLKHGDEQVLEAVNGDKELVEGHVEDRAAKLAGGDQAKKQASHKNLMKALETKKTGHAMIMKPWVQYRSCNWGKACLTD